MNCEWQLKIFIEISLIMMFYKKRALVENLILKVNNYTTEFPTSMSLDYSVTGRNRWEHQLSTHKNLR